MRIRRTRCGRSWVSVSLEAKFRERARKAGLPRAMTEALAGAWRRFDERRSNPRWFESERRNAGPDPVYACPVCGKDAVQSGLRSGGRFLCGAECYRVYAERRAKEDEMNWRRELCRSREVREVRTVRAVAGSR